MSKRKAIPLRVQLAAALCQIGDIPPDHAKALGPEGIRRLFHLDHYPVAKALGGPDEPWNLTFRFIPEHQERTRKIDVPTIAKSKRIASKWAEHQQAIQAKAGRADPPKRKPSRMKSRPMAGSKASPWKKKLNGRVEARAT